jgi:hypothetical protein
MYILQQIEWRYLPRFGNLFIQSAAKCTCTNFILQKSETFLCQSLGNHWKTFPQQRREEIFCYITVNLSCYFLICKQKFWFQKRKHSQLSLKCSRVYIEMNYMYEKFKRSDRPDRFRRLDITVNWEVILL